MGNFFSSLHMQGSHEQAVKLGNEEEREGEEERAIRNLQHFKAEREPTKRRDGHHDCHPVLQARRSLGWDKPSLEWPAIITTASYGGC